MKNSKIRTYSELMTLNTFEERFDYLKLDGQVGFDTFGFDRYMNQKFYKSKEWKDIRDYVIFRDSLGKDFCMDLACNGHEIRSRIIIHHMNPLDANDIKISSRYLLDPEFLVATTHNTHNAIHYGDIELLGMNPVVRKKNDTCPWRK